MIPRLLKKEPEEPSITKSSFLKLLGMPLPAGCPRHPVDVPVVLLSRGWKPISWLVDLNNTFTCKHFKSRTICTCWLPISHFEPFSHWRWLRKSGLESRLLVFFLSGSGSSFFFKRLRLRLLVFFSANYGSKNPKTPSSIRLQLPNPGGNGSQTYWNLYVCIYLATILN